MSLYSLHDLEQSGVGCNIGGVFINVLAYVDDIVLIAPSWRSMQELLTVLDKHVVKIDKWRSQIVSLSFPQLKLGNFCIKYVDSFRYLGHIISSSMRDNDDIQREVRNMFMRTACATVC